ncbi:hypothetical protein [Variovorax sp. OV084]|uniref:hypothetical protein n=1 Tax=Variovorax sp. OV084 TaxID=1882777 RepID=UPI001C43613B|nr:hypothetical protein [Variovorax sp. OV084]
MLRGLSMENTSFKRIARDRFNSRYLTQMALKQDLPAPDPKADQRSFVMYRTKPAARS